MKFTFDISNIFDEDIEERDIKDVSVFDYTANNSNYIVTNSNLHGDENIIMQNTKKDCSSFHNCLQYYNTMPHVQSINNVPIENVLPG